MTSGTLSKKPIRPIRLINWTKLTDWNTIGIILTENSMKLIDDEKRGKIEGHMFAAVAEANDHVKASGPYSNVEFRNTAWNQAYHAAMDRLCKEDGVRV